MWFVVNVLANYPALQDILSGDEIISDSYDLKEVDGIVYEADCAMITEGAVEVGAYIFLPRSCSSQVRF